ncbi:hypothetical protein [Terriglobus saanensis]|uniref:Lipoprotein n=1 Tax=Terriglobus saanensis (strain ATCC BAA-1853 / DSM 23119 / SP1PR4) TaxID=401053 RepID=E8UZ69_TERSS|nr:hypothetical protein [Terriglobus saanensis]ADV82087.1 hypothetical protein AciPR4_1262 [Terriglobus saanensis SP1PR4]
MVRICSFGSWFRGPLFLLLLPLAGCGSGIVDGCAAFASCATVVTQPGSPVISPSAPTTPDPSPTVLPAWVNGFTWIGQSGNTGVYQGYATDGADAHYFFDTGALFKSSSYLQNIPVAANYSPLIDGTIHLGDGAYYAGKVYGIVENWQGCAAPPSRAAIVVFDAQTLNRLYFTDITLSHHETSSITILPDTNEAVVSSYCDGRKLFVYSLPGFQLTRTIPLPTPVALIQGITYNGGFLYIADNNGGLYGLRLADGEERKLHQAPFSGEYEGLDFKNGELRWLINRSDGQHILNRYVPN